MRLFISFNFSDETSARIAHSAAALKKLTKGGVYPPAGNYHMTLAFLGECERSQVKDVEKAMKEAAAASAPFDVTIGGVGCFRRQSGDVFFVKADGGETLGKFHDDLCEALEAKGFVLPDDEKRRDFKPHITICRGAEVSDEILEQVPSETVAYKAERISLMLSARVHGRMRYTELSGMKLG